MFDGVVNTPRLIWVSFTFRISKNHQPHRMAICRRIVSVYLTILWNWRLNGYSSFLIHIWREYENWDVTKDFISSLLLSATLYLDNLDKACNFKLDFGGAFRYANKSLVYLTIFTSKSLVLFSLFIKFPDISTRTSEICQCSIWIYFTCYLAASHPTLGPLSKGQPH